MLLCTWGWGDYKSPRTALFNTHFILWIQGQEELSVTDERKSQSHLTLMLRPWRSDHSSRGHSGEETLSIKPLVENGVPDRQELTI